MKLGRFDKFDIAQGTLDAEFATKFLIGEMGEIIFQIRLQEIIARYSDHDKFPSVIILPDTKARPMGLAIKDLFYYLADANDFPRPKVVFVATPKISKNTTPDNTRELSDQYSLIMISQFAEFANTNILDGSFIREDPYTGRYLTKGDRLIMQEQLLTIRNTLFKRMQKVDITDGSNVLVIDDTAFNFTSFVEIGKAIKSLNVI